MQMSRASDNALDRRSRKPRVRHVTLGAGRLCLAVGLVMATLLQIGGDRLTASAETLREWEHDWTVLTMAPDGAWGVGSDMGVVEAITRAVGHCRTMTAAEIGCGGQFIMFRDAWSLGIRCGDRNILIAERSLNDAELRASWREHELRTLYAPGHAALHRCRRRRPDRKDRPARSLEFGPGPHVAVGRGRAFTTIGSRLPIREPIMRAAMPKRATAGDAWHHAKFRLPPCCSRPSPGRIR